MLVLLTEESLWRLLVVVAAILSTDYLLWSASSNHGRRPNSSTKQRQEEQEEKPGNGSSTSTSTSTSTSEGARDTHEGCGPETAEATCITTVGVKYLRVLVQLFVLVESVLLMKGGWVFAGRLSAIAGVFYSAWPYLVKMSKYRRDAIAGSVTRSVDEEETFRGLEDKLVWTSFIYFLPAIYGIHAHQYSIAVLQAATSWGSTAFHLARETACFNMDNIFAQSLLFTTVWSLVLAIAHSIWWYALVVLIGGPTAIYFIVACGMPGVITCGANGCMHRTSNPDYDFYHMLWHVVSGLGTLTSIHFFETYFPDKEAGGGWFEAFPDIPIVPAVALSLSAGLNLLGNLWKVMPLD